MMVNNSQACRVSLRTTVVWIYHPRCDNELVNLEACGDDKSLCVTATIVKSMQNEEAQCVRLVEVGAATN